MKKYLRNTGTHWTQQEVRKLDELARENTPTRVIGLKLGRPVAGVYVKASKEHITLDPKNRSPYGHAK